MQKLFAVLILVLVTGCTNNPGKQPVTPPPPPTLAVATTNLPIAHLDIPNVNYSAALTAMGGVPPYKWTESGSLPTGLTFDGQAGVLSGKLNQLGGSPFPLTFTVTDSVGTTVATNLTLSTIVDALGQWQIVAVTGGGSVNYLVLEANLSQTDTSVFAGQPSVTLINGTGLCPICSGGPSVNPMTITGLGGACGGSATISGDIMSGYLFNPPLLFTQIGPNGTNTTTVTGNFTAESQTGTGITFPGPFLVLGGDYTTPAGCGFPSDHGAFTGFKINPVFYSGAFSGTLNGQQTTITIVPEPNYTVAISGTSNGSNLTLNGDVIGGAFKVSGTIGGSSVAYLTVFFPLQQGINIYDASTLKFLGTLHR